MCNNPECAYSTCRASRANASAPELPIPGLELSDWTPAVGIYASTGSWRALPRHAAFQSYRFLKLHGWHVAHIRRVYWSGNGGRHTFSVYSMDMRGKPCMGFDTYAEAERHLDKMVQQRMLGEVEPKLWSERA